MPASPDQFSQWKSVLQGKNTADILNTMEEIVREGGWDALGLLTIAGSNLTGLAAELPIHTPNGKKKFSEFREYCIERLQVRLGARQATAARPAGTIRVFMSYTHRDRDAANALALELGRAKADIFLDHWEMSPNDEILPRIERELRDSGAAVVLLSEASSASTWVQRELEIALRKQESDGNFLLLPVLLEPCSLPKALESRPYQDMRDPANRPYVAQAILNEIFRTKPFSQRVAELLNEPPNSPYNQQARLNGFRLLQELAKHRELEIANNQKWFLWEAFHELLPNYSCTIKVGRVRGPGGSGESYEFTVIDRWNSLGHVIILSAEELDRGLWHGELDLLQGGNHRSDDLRFVGDLGRFSLNRAFNPNVKTNTADAVSSGVMAPILKSFLRFSKPFDEGARGSFLYDYQRLLVPADWHRVKVVVGAVRGGETLAFSPMVRGSERDETSVVFELYDPFFASLKYTLVYKNQLGHTWESGIDLMSSDSETLLGLA